MWVALSLLSILDPRFHNSTRVVESELEVQHYSTTDLETEQMQKYSSKSVVGEKNMAYRIKSSPECLDVNSIYNIWGIMYQQSSIV